MSLTTSSLMVEVKQTAVEREGKQKGYIIGFSFTRGAYEEAARAKADKALDIKLVPVASLLGPGDAPDLRTPELSDMFPEPPESFLDLPLPKARDRRARPSLKELVESDQRNA
jgi:hypothetical protein